MLIKSLLCIVVRLLVRIDRVAAMITTVFMRLTHPCRLALWGAVQKQFVAVDTKVIPVLPRVLSLLNNPAILHDIHVCNRIQQHLIAAAKVFINTRLVPVHKTLLCCGNTEAGIDLLCLDGIRINVFQAHGTFSGTAHKGSLFHIPVQAPPPIMIITSALRILHAVIQIISLQSHGI